MKAKSIIARILLALTIAAAAAACVKFDDSGIQSELSDIKSRLSALEQKANTDIAGLWEIVNALKGGITISSIGETDDAWIIIFSNGKTATLSKGGAGSTPVVGVRQDTDGIYYWTLHGQWMLDSGGNKLPVSGTPGQSPQLKIEGGDWYVSTDEGKTWTKLGKATGEDGDAFFKEVTWDDDYVYLTLRNGTKIKLLRGAGLVASIAAIPDYSDGAVKAGTGLFTIRFKVEPGSAAEGLLYLDNKCFKLSAAYTETKASAGELTTLPVHELDAKDGILTITTDGESLAKEFASKKLGVSAALFISDGASLAVNSGYFPLYPKNEYNGHGYVDLGLESGNKFADTNLGAENPWEPGNYYAWSETEPKATYTWNSYKFLASWGSWESMKVNKYCQSSNSKYWGGPGTPDNKDTLESQDDVAHVKWGGNWRMPTYADYKELKDNCTWTWTDNYKGTGTAGQIVTSNIAGHEDKSIFLPAAGHYSGPDDNGTVGSVGYYWSSSLRNDPRHSYYVEFGSNGLSNYIGTTRDYGNSVRPVYGEFVPVSSISLDKPSLELQSGEKAQLTATVSPSNATAKDVHWESSDESIAKVDGGGLVTAVAPGTATITAYGSSGVSTSCVVTVKEKEGPKAVDLGLPSGLKWASCNVGATNPEQFGDYFSWGETETKNEYTWSTYKWGNGDWDADEHLSKYNTDPSCGNVDGNTMLLPEDDVAQDKWKGGWRMPTDAEWTELRDYCTWTWTVSYEGTGVAGYIVEGTKNSSIFLPATGHMEDEFLLDPGVNCGYWSSNIDPDNPAYAWFVYFEEGGVYRTIGPRKYGYSVRPVSE